MKKQEDEVQCILKFSPYLIRTWCFPMTQQSLMLQQVAMIRRLWATTGSSQGDYNSLESIYEACCNCILLTEYYSYILLRMLLGYVSKAGFPLTARISKKLGLNAYRLYSECSEFYYTLLTHLTVSLTANCLCCRGKGTRTALKCP